MVPSVPLTALANRFPGKGSQVVSRAGRAIGSNGTPGKSRVRAIHPRGRSLAAAPAWAQRGCPWHAVAGVNALARGGINDIAPAGQDRGPRVAEIEGAKVEKGVQARRAFVAGARDAIHSCVIVHPRCWTSMAIAVS